MNATNRHYSEGIVNFKGRKLEFIRHSPSSMIHVYHNNYWCGSISITASLFWTVSPELEFSFDPKDLEIIFEKERESGKEVSHE
jgi:hypothetical protein